MLEGTLIALMRRIAAPPAALPLSRCRSTIAPPAVLPSIPRLSLSPGRFTSTFLLYPLRADALSPVRQCPPAASLPLRCFSIAAASLPPRSSLLLHMCF